MFVSRTRAVKKHDDYLFGPHHFSIHFWCGLVFGAVLGAYWSGQCFDQVPLIWIGTVVTGLVIAFCCGRWGDSAWHWLIEKCRWWV